MLFDIDTVIFGIFLIINIVVGLYHARGVTTIREYAVGKSNFTTITIAATLMATCISGSSFFNRITETYNHGLYDILATSGFALNLIIIGYLFAPRLSKFLGKLSIADAMGSLYGSKVRIITAFCGSIAAAGLIAVQLKVAGRLMEYGFDVPGIYGVIIAGVIVALYSSLGGIRSVTFTDVIQLFTFGTIIPTIAFFIFNHLSNDASIIHTLKTNELFDYHKVFDFSREESFAYLLLFFFFIIPDFNPAIFQRVAMARNSKQIQQSFIMAGIGYLFIICMMAFIGLLVLTVDSNLDPKNLVKYIILDYSYVGLKGLTLAGIMAMVMSTADSFINSTAVLLVHDFWKPLKKIKLIKNELVATRLASVLITILAFFLTLTEDNLRNLMIQALNFYFPVVSMPFILAVFGFRTNSTCVLIAMAAGFISILISKFFLQYDGVQSSLLGVSINLTFLFASHYLLKAPGGWNVNDNKEILRSISQQRKYKWKKLIQKIANINLLLFLKNNTPKRESIFIAVSLFSMIVTYAAVFTISEEVKQQYIELVEVIYPSMLFIITALLSYPLWPSNIKDSNAIVIVWYLVLFYILVCASFFFVLISNFSSIQLTIFMINLILLSILLRWQLALIIIVSGVMLTALGLKLYLGEDILSMHWQEVQFKVSYLLILISGILVAFLRPKQAEQDLAAIKEAILTKEMEYKDDELSRSLALKHDFINNISHEVRAPLVGILSLSNGLYDIYKKLTPVQLDKSIKAIAESSKKLEELMNNILDFSKLSSSKYQLELKPINLSELVYQCIDICSKYDSNNKEPEFITNIEDNLIVEGNEHYLSSCLINLIINAIKYGQDHKIIINLINRGKIINFAITDKGIGIPEAELQTIFDLFVESSRTHTAAGGRGVGLALSKKTIELHRGKIWAVNNKNGGATFHFILPKLELQKLRE